METLGKRLRILRKDKSQLEFATLIGVDRTTLSSWENDRREPDLNMLSYIANMFDVSIDWLAGNKPLPPIIPIANSTDHLNILKEFSADFAIRLPDNNLAFAGLTANDIAIFKSSNTASNNQITAFRMNSTIKVCLYTTDDSIEVIGTLIAVIKQPSILTQHQITSLKNYHNPKWRELIDFLTAHDITPENVKLLVNSALTIKTKT